MTGPAVGIQTVWGTAVESTYGTAVTVDRFYEVLDDSIQRNNKVIQSNGLRGGTRNMRRGSRRTLAANDATGDVNLEVATNGFGRQLAQILGGTPTITAGSGGNAAAITQVYPMGSVAGKSQTVQKQLVDSGGNHIETVTRKGSKIMKAEFSIKSPAGGSGAGAGGILVVKLTFDCQNEDDGVAAATSSYVSTRLFNFSQAALTIGGTPVASVLDATVAFSNPQDVNRYFLGNAGLKSEPADSDYPTVDGQLTAEILDGSFYTLFKPDTAAAFLMTFTGGVVPGASTTHETFQISIPEIHITADPMAVAGVGVVRSAIKYEGAYDGTDPGATITYITSDAAA